MMTTAPEAKARVVALLQAWPGLSGLEVRYGPPMTDPRFPSHRRDLSLGAVTKAEGQWGALGNRRTIENYHIAIALTLEISDTDEQTAEQQAADLYLEVTKALKSDPALGGMQGSLWPEPLLRNGCYLTDGELTSYLIDQPYQGFAVVANGQIACEATVVS